MRDNTSSLSLTFDAEEWQLPAGIESVHNRSTEFSKEGCIGLARVLGAYNVRATFFVTEYFARRQPDLVKSLDAQGHEIASHGHANVDLTGLSRQDLKLFIASSRSFLCGLIAKEIKGFRAPLCHFNSDMINVLVELGYRYDSSIHPAIVPGRYYNWGYPLAPFFFGEHNITTKDGAGILEIPMSVVPLIRMPISWWWMRNIGSWLTDYGVSINLKSGRNTVLYFHPWEYAQLPRVEGLPLHYTRGCGPSFLEALRRLIDKYIRKVEFVTLAEVSERYWAKDKKPSAIRSISSIPRKARRRP